MLFSNINNRLDHWNSCYVDLTLSAPLGACLKQLQSYTKLRSQSLRPFSPYALQLTKADDKYYKFRLRSSIYKSKQINVIATYADGDLSANDLSHTTIHIRVRRFIWTDIMRWWSLLGGTLPTFLFCGLAIHVFEINGFKALALICLTLAYCCWYVYSHIKTATVMRDELLETLLYYFEKLEDKYVIVSDY